jgi:hypothetical protein
VGREQAGSGRVEGKWRRAGMGGRHCAVKVAHAGIPPSLQGVKVPRLAHGGSAVSVTPTHAATACRPDRLAAHTTSSRLQTPPSPSRLTMVAMSNRVSPVCTSYPKQFPATGLGTTTPGSTGREGGE